MYADVARNQRKYTGWWAGGLRECVHEWCVERNSESPIKTISISEDHKHFMLPYNNESRIEEKFSYKTINKMDFHINFPWMRKMHGERMRRDVNAATLFWL